MSLTLCLACIGSTDWIALLHLLHHLPTLLPICPPCLLPNLPTTPSLWRKVVVRARSRRPLTWTPPSSPRLFRRWRPTSPCWRTNCPSWDRRSPPTQPCPIRSREMCPSCAAHRLAWPPGFSAQREMGSEGSYLPFFVDILHTYSSHIFTLDSWRSRELTSLAW